MANDRARGEGQSSPSNEQQDGVRTVGNLSAPGVTHVGKPSRDEEFVDSSVNVAHEDLVVISGQSPNSAVSQRISQYGVSVLRRLYQ